MMRLTSLGIFVLMPTTESNLPISLNNTLEIRFGFMIIPLQSFEKSVEGLKYNEMISTLKRPIIVKSCKINLKMNNLFEKLLNMRLKDANVKKEKDTIN